MRSSVITKETAKLTEYCSEFSLKILQQQGLGEIAEDISNLQQLNQEQAKQLIHISSPLLLKLCELQTQVASDVNITPPTQNSNSEKTSLQQDLNSFIKCIEKLQNSNITTWKPSLNYQLDKLPLAEDAILGLEVMRKICIARLMLGIKTNFIIPTSILGNNLSNIALRFIANSAEEDKE